MTTVLMTLIHNVTLLLAMMSVFDLVTSRNQLHELKPEVNELLARAGQPPRYPSAAGGDEG